MTDCHHGEEEPVHPQESGEFAVKVINHYGDEVLKAPNAAASKRGAATPQRLAASRRRAAM
jgi:hypothetical protein